jgi:peptide/nickel transport system permease protein
MYQWLLYIVIFILFNWLIYYLTKDRSSFKKYKIDPDTILVKTIEIRKSFPGIFILLALTSLFVLPSVWNIIFIITLLGWTEFARLARAETLAVKNENFITAVKVLGFGHFRIIFRHILPNILSSLIVIACFSVSSAIILESTLSFLGIGLPVEQVTWGKMMAEGRDMQLWWLVLFPGLALFIIILCLNTIADVWSGKDGKK